MQNNNTIPTDTTSRKGDPPLSEPKTRIGNLTPKLIVVFTLDGMKRHTINADTAEEQEQIQELLEQIRPCLDIAQAILKKGCTEQTV